MKEVGQHHLAHDAWVVVDGKVYEQVFTLPSRSYCGGTGLISVLRISINITRVDRR